MKSESSVTKKTSAIIDQSTSPVGFISGNIVHILYFVCQGLREIFLLLFREQEDFLKVFPCVLRSNPGSWFLLLRELGRSRPPLPFLHSFLEYKRVYKENN